MKKTVTRKERLCTISSILTQNPSEIYPLSYFADMSVSYTHLDVYKRQMMMLITAPTTEGKIVSIAFVTSVSLIALDHVMPQI